MRKFINKEFHKLKFVVPHSIILLVLHIALNAKAQSPVFTITANCSNDTCFWYLQNKSGYDVDVSSVSIRFFHNNKSDIFFPVTPIHINYSNTFTGPFIGKNLRWNYKTLQISGLDSFMKDGEKRAITFVQNYQHKKDSVMAANIEVHYTESGKSKFVPAFPEGVSPCQFSNVFVNNGFVSSGVKYGSFANATIHPNNCNKDLTVIIFDRTSLKVKSFPNVVPRCVGGRFGTDFGYSSDSILYYSFDFSKSTDVLGFDTLVNHIGSGDFVAIVRDGLGNTYPPSSTLTSFQNLGFDKIPAGQIAGLGRKGMSIGGAILDTCTANCYISFEQALLPETLPGNILPYAACFESIIKVVDTAKQIANVKWNSLSKFNVYPNPAQDKLYFSGLQNNAIVKIYTTSGQWIGEYKIEKSGVDIANLSSGVYLVIPENQSILPQRFIKE